MDLHLDTDGAATGSLDEGEFAAALLANVPEGTLAVDADDRIVYANPAIEEVLGYAPADLLGRPTTTIVPDRLVESNEAGLRGVVEAADGEADMDGAEFPAIHSDGHEVAVLVSLRSFELEGRQFFVGVLRDISDRAESEAELERRKRKIEALHAVATEIGRCETAEATYEAVVDAAETILDFDIALADAVIDGMLVPRAVSAELSRDEIYETTPVDAPDNIAAEAYRTGEPSVVDDLRTRDASPADPEFRSLLTVPIGDYGVFQSGSREVNAFDEEDRRMTELLVSHAEARLGRIDTERRLRDRTDELERQNERLEEFASMVSHDLRNPLNVAEGRLELAREECDSDHLDDVADAHDRMRRLVEDVLALAREGEDAADVRPVSIADVAERCWEAVGTPDADLEVTSTRTIEADPDRLRQLLENLFRNAVEHGGDDVTIRVEDVPGGFAVSDDGEGIPPDERDRVLTSGYTTSERGTGFGLSIVERIADAHDWAVAVGESDDGGARFTITGVESVEDR